MLRMLPRFPGGRSSSFPEVLTGLFVTAPEWSQRLWRAYDVPSPTMGHYIPDRFFP